MKGLNKIYFIETSPLQLCMLGKKTKQNKKKSVDDSFKYFSFVFLVLEFRIWRNMQMVSLGVSDPMF